MGRWPGNSQRKSGRFARIDSPLFGISEIPRLRYYLETVLFDGGGGLDGPIRANHLRLAELKLLNPFVCESRFGALKR